MSDKPVAGLIAVVAVAPICVVCILAPVFIGSASTWVTGWFSGWPPVVTTGLAIIAGLLVFGLLRRKASGRTSADRRQTAPLRQPDGGQQ